MFAAKLFSTFACTGVPYKQISSRRDKKKLGLRSDFQYPGQNPVVMRTNFEAIWSNLEETLDMCITVECIWV